MKMTKITWGYFFEEIFLFGWVWANLILIVFTWCDLLSLKWCGAIGDVFFITALWLFMKSYIEWHQNLQVRNKDKNQKIEKKRFPLEFADKVENELMLTKVFSRGGK